jgi:CheY-like chemotaxis protein
MRDKVCRAHSVNMGLAAVVAMLLCCVLAAPLPPTAAQQQADAEEEPAGDAAAPAPAPRELDPAVKALLESRPTTADELLEAILIIIDLNQPVAAQPLLRQLMAAGLDDAAMADLAARFGSAAFIKLGSVAALKPQGAEFARQVLEAAQRHAQDPARLSELVEQLKSPSPNVRQSAALHLRMGEEQAVLALIAALQDPSFQDHLPALRAALAMQQSAAVEPLVAVLEGATDDLARQAALVLGRLGRQAEFALYAPALGVQVDPALQEAARSALEQARGALPLSGEAAAELYRLAKAYFNGQREASPNAAGGFVLWHWDAPSRQPVTQEVDARTATLRLALRHAEGARRILPTNPRLQRLRLSILLEIAGRETAAGTTQPDAQPDAWAELRRLDLATLETLLEENANQGHAAAASAAAEILGESGNADVLYTRQPRLSPLVQAVQHPNRRLRFAALAAVMRLNPQHSYPGSSHVVEALGYFAGTLGMPRAVAAAPQLHEARRLAGMLVELGYEAEAVTTNRELLRLATSSPDYELLLVDARLALPASGQVLQALRRDVRTAHVPVAVVASLDDLPAAERLAAQHDRAAAFVRPQDLAGMRFQVEHLLAGSDARPAPPAERLAQAQQALAWLAQLAETRPALYDLRRVEMPVTLAAWVPELTLAATHMLGKLGSPLAQRTLLELASRTTQPLEARRAALAAFGASLAAHGTLLTTQEIALQYERYNQSERQDRQSQQILGRILDLIEARAAADSTIPE